MSPIVEADAARYKPAAQEKGVFPFTLGKVFHGD
jgi:hypothetical protein